MYIDGKKRRASCLKCAIDNGSRHINRRSLFLIPVQHLFQIVGVHVMHLPVTDSGNHRKVVLPRVLTKWPLVYPVPGQKAARLVKLLTKEIIPLFSVLETLLSDCGTSLMSTLMLDICKKLGINKLNTTTYHSESDGMVEHLNRTLMSSTETCFHLMDLNGVNT